MRVRIIIRTGKRRKGDPAVVADSPPGPAAWRDVRFPGRTFGLVAAGIAVLTVGYVLSLPLGPRPDALAEVTGARRITPEAGLATDPAISPDGSLVAYASAQGPGNLHIWLQPVSGRAAIQLTRDAANDTQPDIHPDGAHVVFRSERDGGGIFVASAMSTDPPRLVALHGRRPRYSPDGQWIAFYEDASALDDAGSLRAAVYVVPTKGGPLRQIQPRFRKAQFPVWTPDSKAILLEGISDAGVSDWWIAPVDGGEALPTSALAGLRRAFWSLSGPDSLSGHHALFSASTSEQKSIWGLSLDQDWKARGEPERLTFGSGEQRPSAAGPKGMIAYASRKSSFDVWAVPIRGNRGESSGEPWPISTDSSYSHLPSMARDGRKVIYLSNRGGAEDLWVADAHNGAGNPVTSNLRITHRPVISPDGRKALVSGVNGRDCLLMVADLSTGRQEFSLEACAGIWDWSADGKSVLFFEPNGIGSKAVHLMRIPSARRTEILWHPRFAIFSARFSPDGRWIAFAAGPALGSTRLYIVLFRGETVELKDWIPITEQVASAPAWSPNGQLLYYRSPRDGFDCIWVQRLTASAQPAGDPIPVRHFHNATLGLYEFPQPDFEMSVGTDKLVLGLTRNSGSIWLGNAGR